MKNNWKLTQEDIKEIKKELIYFDINELNFDKKTAKQWANRTTKIIKEVFGRI